MVSKKAVAIAIPTLAAAGFLGYKLYEKAYTRILYLSAGEGGTTKPPPGTYRLRLGQKITLQAVPNEGYTYGTWTVDGADWGHVPQITVTMDTDHIVICTFWKGGTPPPTYPVGIKALEELTVKELIGAWFDKYTWCWEGHIRVQEFFGQNPLRFLVYDAQGRGVPDVDVTIWTDKPPDSHKYQGSTLLNGEVHTLENQLIIKTDSQGIATVNVNYRYGLNDNYKKICSDAGLGFTVATCTPIPVPYDDRNVYNCRGWTNLIALLSTWGEGDTATTPAMGGWALNWIYAQVVGTAISTQTMIKCGFHVKWVTVS
jgi:hypothetical protein